jgi:hypothetical protein
LRNWPAREPRNAWFVRTLQAQGRVFLGQSEAAAIARADQLEAQLREADL